MTLDIDKSANDEAIEAWNTVLFDKFCRFRHLLTTGLAFHGDVAVERHGPRPGERVLDVGCGFGDTTMALAKVVGPTGSAFGVDAAARFIETARREAGELGIANVRFAAGDVQTLDLGGPFDLAFARFGTMFFANPMLAMKNVRRSLSPGGRLCIVVWRKREDNDWLHAAERVTREIVPPEAEASDEPTCGPGPFSMAGADFVSDILKYAGFREIALQRHDAPICIGRDVNEAVEFALALGPAGEIVRLAGKNGEKYLPRVTAALRDVLSQFARSDGVFAASSTWIVTALAA